MISFLGSKYELDEKDSFVTAVVQCASSYTKWSIEVHSRETDGMHHATVSNAQQDDDCYEPLLARLDFSTPASLDWTELWDAGVSVEFEEGKDIHVEPNDPACLCVGEAYLPLRHHVRMSIVGERHMRVKWQCDAYDTFWIDAISGEPSQLLCDVPIPFTGVCVKLSDPSLAFDPKRSFGDLINKRPPARPLHDKAVEAMQPFLKVAEFDQAQVEAGGFFYPLRRFKQSSDLS